jgi:hypothetical protein
MEIYLLNKVPGNQGHLLALVVKSITRLQTIFVTLLKLKGYTHRELILGILKLNWNTNY